MAEQNFKPENAIAKTESDESETSSENCELVRKKSAKRSQRKSATATSQPLARTEFYDRMRHDYMPLQGDWLSLAGFTPGMPVKRCLTASLSPPRTPASCGVVPRG